MAPVPWRVRKEVKRDLGQLFALSEMLLSPTRLSSTNLWESQSSTGWFMLDDVIESVRTVIGDIDGMDTVPVRGIVEVKSRRCNLRKERREEKGIGQSLARQEVLESSSNSL